MGQVDEKWPQEASRAGLQPLRRAMEAAGQDLRAERQCLQRGTGGLKSTGWGVGEGHALGAAVSL